MENIRPALKIGNGEQGRGILIVPCERRSWSKRAKVLFARNGKRGKGKHKTFPPFPLPFSRLMQEVYYASIAGL